MFFKKIVFIGPQGTGKTTQTLLLRLWMRRVYNIDINVRKHIHYTILHKALLYIVTKVAKLFGRIELIKFYKDEPPVLSPSGEIFRIFFPLLLFAHITALAVDSTLFRIHREIFVDDEGFVFKQVADLYYLAHKFGLLPSKYFMLFLRLALGLVNKLEFKTIVLQIRNYRILVDRYEKQKTSAYWRKNEPEDYISLQQAVYNRITKELAHVCFVNAQQDTFKVFREVLICLKLQ